MDELLKRYNILLLDIVTRINEIIINKGIIKLDYPFYVNESNYIYEVFYNCVKYKTTDNEEFICTLNDINDIEILMELLIELESLDKE